MVFSWLLNSTSKEIVASCIYINIARELWCDLQQCYLQTNAPRIFQLQKEIGDLMQDDLSVSAYFTRLKTLWDELMNYMSLPSCISSRNCNCEILKAVLDHRQLEYAMHFLMRLNDTFASVRSQILLIDPFPNINRVFSLILQEERQRGIHSIVKFVNTDSTALVSTTQQQNSQKFTPRNKFSSKPKPMCSHYGIVGHTKKKCYKLHGYPPGYKFTKSRINSVNGNPSVNVSQEEHTFEGSSLPFTQE
ncbi:uncharacterized protein LOC122278574 [Carya illinoinensis]|uniref:uncharacterized protein LOC122278574 n=1 Tax=Carya illinoinensis TaxID=32201 RepID=UPI001C7299F4|nr:uncharacterized protein LOC122278574 [Carya illinoinensis]